MRWRRAIVVWLVLIGVEVVHGTLRRLFLVPLIGDARARRLGVFTGSLLNLGVACLFARWRRAAAVRSLAAVGLLWLGPTLIFEVGFGRFVARSSWSRLLADDDVRRGGLLPFGLAALAASPLIAARLRGVSPGADRGHRRR